MMIFIACALTALIETPFMALFGFHRRDDLIIVICANVISNLLLNLSILFLSQPLGAGIYVLEALVVAFEFAIFSFAFKPSLRLFTLCLSANALSYGLGLLIF